jgi:hypothetical protein
VGVVISPTCAGIIWWFWWWCWIFTNSGGPGTANQGYAGGDGGAAGNYGAGGGGGAGALGEMGQMLGGAGGDGVFSDITGSLQRGVVEEVGVMVKLASGYWWCWEVVAGVLEATGNGTNGTALTGGGGGGAEL